MAGSKERKNRAKIPSLDDLEKMPESEVLDLLQTSPEMAKLFAAGVGDLAALKTQPAENGAAERTRLQRLFQKWKKKKAGVAPEETRMDELARANYAGDLNAPPSAPDDRRHKIVREPLRDIWQQRLEALEEDLAALGEEATHHYEAEFKRLLNEFNALNKTTELPGSAEWKKLRSELNDLEQAWQSLRYKIELAPNPKRAQNTQDQRNLAEYVVSKVGSYEELNAPTLSESEEKFNRAFLNYFKDVTVHGGLKQDKKTGEWKLTHTGADLDGRVTIFLLNQVGLKLAINPDALRRDPAKAQVTVVKKGEAPLAGSAAFDYGNELGVQLRGSAAQTGERLDEAQPTFIVDHHGPEVGERTSTAEMVYNLLKHAGLLKESPALDKLVEFTTAVDNADYPTSGAKFTTHHHRTLYGLRDRIRNFEAIIQFFERGGEPGHELSDEELKKFGLIGSAPEKDENGRVIKDKNGKVVTKDYNLSENQKESDEKSWQRLEAMEKEGMIVDSARYGKVFVDIEKQVPTGFPAVRAFCEAKGIKQFAYLIWAPQKHSFFFSASGDITDTFSQGIKQRRRMWIKPREEDSPLIITLGEILETITDGAIKRDGAGASGGLPGLLSQEHAARSGGVSDTSEMKALSEEPDAAAPSEPATTTQEPTPSTEPIAPVAEPTVGAEVTPPPPPKPKKRRPSLGEETAATVTKSDLSSVGPTVSRPRRPSLEEITPGYTAEPRPPRPPREAMASSFGLDEKREDRLPPDGFKNIILPAAPEVNPTLGLKDRIKVGERVKVLKYYQTQEKRLRNDLEFLIETKRELMWVVARAEAIKLNLDNLESIYEDILLKSSTNDMSDGMFEGRCFDIQNVILRAQNGYNEILSGLRKEKRSKWLGRGLLGSLGLAIGTFVYSLWLKGEQAAPGKDIEQELKAANEPPRAVAKADEELAKEVERTPEKTVAEFQKKIDAAARPAREFMSRSASYAFTPDQIGGGIAPDTTTSAPAPETAVPVAPAEIKIREGQKSEVSLAGTDKKLLVKFNYNADTGEVVSLNMESQIHPNFETAAQKFFMPGESIATMVKKMSEPTIPGLTNSQLLKSHLVFLQFYDLYHDQLSDKSTPEAQFVWGKINERLHRMTQDFGGRPPQRIFNPDIMAKYY